MVQKAIFFSGTREVWMTDQCQEKRFHREAIHQRISVFFFERDPH